MEKDICRRRRMRRVALFVGRSLTFVSSNATITPAITLSGDGPCQWEVTEANGAKYYYSANAFSHTRSVAGDMTVRLLNTMRVAPYVTVIDFNGDGIVSSILALQLGIFGNLTTLHLRNNLLTGDLSGIILPTGLTTLSLYSNLLTGDLLGVILPTGLTTLSLFTNLFTGLYRVPNPTAINTYIAYSQGATNMTQPRIDAFVTDVYSKRAGFTYATPTFNIGGTNANPSGIYQNPHPNPPATPLEMIWCLVNDPFAEGFNKQVWTY